MKSNLAAPAARPVNSRWWLWLILCLLGILALLFSRSFQHGWYHFANDGPLGANSAQAAALPEGFKGIWQDLHWLGYGLGSTPPDILFGQLFLLGPLNFMKFNVPISLFILGVCAAVFFRQLGFKPMVCVVGGLAAALNSNYVSSACWGTPGRALTLGMAFLAMAALANRSGRYGLLKTILAGFAVGMGIMEGSDYGAIFSLYVAAFAMAAALVREQPLARNVAYGVGRVSLVAVCAALISAQALISLVSTNIKGVAGMEPELQTSEFRWDWATQWSLPKTETLRVIIPGLFGYRMDAAPPTPEGGQYWGSVGQSPGWAEHHTDQEWMRSHPGAWPRNSGAGEYAGVIVVLVALWALAQSGRRTGAVFSPSERKLVWFWGAAALVSLLLAFGRHAPFYRLIFALPYFSSIRNPIKWMHPFHMAVLVLFAYGLQGLYRAYLEPVIAKPASLAAHLKSWWAKALPFEKKWTFGAFGAVVVGILGFLIYSSARKDLVVHLSNVGFDPTEAAGIARFSAGEVGWFLFFLILSVALITVIMSGALAGGRARWAGLLLGVLVVGDLARASTPWIKYENTERYASNPILDFLRQKPYEHRVTTLPRPARATQGTAVVGNVYDVEWMQHQFPYYNIQSLDIPQEPRPPADKEAYLRSVGGNILRYWQLTNTRYVLGVTEGFGSAASLNQQLDPAQQRFRLLTAFRFYRAPDSDTIGVETNAAGDFALIEFAGALPRAKLYPQWAVSTNDPATLARLADPAFDPAQTVLVADAIPASGTPSGQVSADAVEFISYAPKHIEQRTRANVPTVLLLNDHFNANWKVRVDGQPAKLLRCNFIMRGVQLPPGQHVVVWDFEQPLNTLYVTLGAIGIGLLICGFLIVVSARPAEPKAPAASRPAAGTPAGRK